MRKSTFFFASLVIGVAQFGAVGGQSKEDILNRILESAAIRTSIMKEIQSAQQIVNREERFNKLASLAVPLTEERLPTVIAYADGKARGQSEFDRKADEGNAKNRKQVIESILFKVPFDATLSEYDFKTKSFQIGYENYRPGKLGPGHWFLRDDDLAKKWRMLGKCSVNPTIGASVIKKLDDKRTVQGVAIVKVRQAIRKDDIQGILLGATNDFVRGPIIDARVSVPEVGNVYLMKQ